MGSLHLSHRNLDRGRLQSGCSLAILRCRMLSIDEDTFVMISGLIVVAVVSIAGLLALGV